MRALFLALTFSIAASSAQGQEFKDSTDTVLTADQKAALLSLLLSNVTDPFSTQIVRLHQSTTKPDNYCGFLNSKNLNGAYTGFKPFRFIPNGPRIYVDAACD